MREKVCSYAEKMFEKIAQNILPEDWMLLMFIVCTLSNCPEDFTRRVSDLEETSGDFLCNMRDLVGKCETANHNCYVSLITHEPAGLPLCLPLKNAFLKSPGIQSFVTKLHECIKCWLYSSFLGPEPNHPRWFVDQIIK